MKIMARGNPRGSHVLSGSLDSATRYSDPFLWVWNTSSPQGVMGGISLIFAATSPPQKPVKSRFGAGPPVPVLANAAARLVLPSLGSGLGLAVCAAAYDEKASAAARTTIEPLSRFSMIRSVSYRIGRRARTHPSG